MSLYMSPFKNFNKLGPADHCITEHSRHVSLSVHRGRLVKLIGAISGWRVQDNGDS